MSDLLVWTPTLFEVPGSGFSSSKRYVRKAASGGYALAAGAHVTGLFWFENVNTKGVAYACKIGSARNWAYSPTASTTYSSATPTPVVESVEI